MSEVIRIVKMPFLIEDPIEFLRKHGVVGAENLWEALDLLRATDRALEILRVSLEQGVYPEPGDRVTLPREVTAFHAVALTLAWSGSKIAARRFAVAVSKYAGGIMRKMSDEGLVVTARLLGVDMRIEDKGVRIPYMKTIRGVAYRVLRISLGLRDYIRLSARLRGDPKWKLTNQPLWEGRVYLPERSMAPRLLEEKVTERVLEIINKYSEAVKPGTVLPEPLSTLAASLQELLSKTSPRREGRGEGFEARGPIIYDAFPPCMQKILQEAREGGNLSHHERFAIATFLIQLGADEDEVIDVFRQLPDFNEKKTRYQVEHLMGKRGSGKKYMTYSCETMKTLGLCVGECKTKTPLEAYWKNLRSLRRGRNRETRGSGGD